MTGPGRVAGQAGGVFRRCDCRTRQCQHAWYFRTRTGGKEVRHPTGPGWDGERRAWEELERLQGVEVLPAAATPQVAPEAPTPPPRDFLSPAELAKETGLSVELVRQHLALGKVPGGRRFGRRWVIHRPTFAASFAASPPAAPAPRIPSRRRRGHVGTGNLARIASSL